MVGNPEIMNPELCRVGAQAKTAPMGTIPALRF